MQRKDQPDQLGTQMKLIKIASICVLTAAFVSQASASETKNIYLSGGVSATAQVTIYIHNALPITVRFKLHRDGSDNDFGQRLVDYKVISANGASYNAQRSIGAAVETFEVTMPEAGGANAVRLWKVELKNLEPSTNAEVNKAVSGTVEFFTTGSITKYPSGPANFNLGKSEEVTKTFSLPFTGNLTIQANWDTDEISLEAYQLYMELWKGDRIITGDTGYSRDSFIPGISDSQRFKITIQASAGWFQVPGDWKLKIKGSSKGKVKNVDLKIKISDGIYE
jgi:hypothetical protein